MEIGWGTSNLEKPRESQASTPCACGGAVVHPERLEGLLVHSVCVWRGRLADPKPRRHLSSLRVRVEGPDDPFVTVYATNVHSVCVWRGRSLSGRLQEAPSSTPCACGGAAPLGGRGQRGGAFTPCACGGAGFGPKVLAHPTGSLRVRAEGPWRNQ
jgi:hypothetical protein